MDPGVLRRASGAPGSRHRRPAARCGAPPRARVPARDALGVADPKAVRRYRMAGFDLHPQMLLWGHVDRSAIPVIERVREGSAGDFDLMDSVDRGTRGAAHGPDHAVLADEFHLLVTDRSTGAGYVYVTDAGTPVLLAATNRRTATDLAWAALAMSPPTCRSRSRTSPRPTSGRSTSAWRPVSSCHQLGYLAPAPPQAAGAVPAPRLVPLSRSDPSCSKVQPGAGTLSTGRRPRLEPRAGRDVTPAQDAAHADEHEVVVMARRGGWARRRRRARGVRGSARRARRCAPRLRARRRRPRRARESSTRAPFSTTTPGPARC